MGIIKNYTEDNCQIAIWDITESLEELTKLGSGIDISKFKSEKRKKEFLACELLLNEISPNITITYNEFGVPELDNGQHISISHSKNLVAIIISKTKVGLDIEQISDKPLRLSLKFISTKAHQNLTQEKATLIWCCKEAIFKWYQKGSVDFKKDIKINEFDTKEKGEVICNFKGEEIIVKYKKINNHYLVYVCK